jgi:peptidoglycan/LPS O-acetylase OafA/YrhL
MAEVLTPTCMQAFASGGLLAYFHVKKGSEFHQLKYYFLIPGLMSFGYLILGLNGFLPLLLDLRTIISIFMVGLIAAILINPNFFISSKILGNPALVFLGKISYGIYLFHNFIPLFFNSILHWMERRYIYFPLLNYEDKLYNQNFIFYISCFILLVLFCFISFKVFENPINLLKKRFV